MLTIVVVVVPLSNDQTVPTVSNVDGGTELSAPEEAGVPSSDRLAHSALCLCALWVLPLGSHIHSISPVLVLISYLLWWSGLWSPRWQGDVFSC